MIREVISLYTKHLFSLLSNPLTGDQVRAIHSTVVSKCYQKSLESWWLFGCITKGLRKAYSKAKSEGFDEAMKWLESISPEELYDP